MRKLLPLILICSSIYANASDIHIPVSIANDGLIKANDQILVSVNMPSTGFYNVFYDYDDKLEGNITCTMITNPNSKPIKIYTLSGRNMDNFEYHEATNTENDTEEQEVPDKITTTLKAKIWWDESNVNNPIDFVIKNIDSINTVRISCDATVDEDQYLDLHY